MKYLKKYYGQLIILFAILSVYWQSLALPFIQDDWASLTFTYTDNFFASLKPLFSFNNFFYRPLAQTYLFFARTIFGLNPLPFHIAALVIHFINSLLAIMIINKVTANRTIAYLTGLLYSAAIAVHQDTLAWAVGIFDLGGALFFFLSILLFLHNRIIASVLMYFIGCLFKESVIILPIVLFSYRILITPGIRFDFSLLKLFRATLPYVLIMVSIAGIKVFQGSHFHHLPTDPYALDFFGTHIVKNSYFYIAWMFQSFFALLPMMEYSSPVAKVSSVGILLISTYLLLVIWRALYKNPQRPLILFLFIWLAAGLLPVIFLPNHAFRYYCTYSLPPFIALLFLLCESFLSLFPVKRSTIKLLLGLTGAASIISSIDIANSIYRQGLNQLSLADGTNMLIRKAAFVDIIKPGLLQALTDLPSNSVIIIARADIWSFNKDSGPQLWFKNSTIRTYDFDELKYEEGSLYIEEQNDISRIKTRNLLAPGKLFIFQVLDNKLEKVDVNDAKAYLASLRPH